MKASLSRFIVSNNKMRVIFISILLMYAGSSFAEKLYVTDRILLGIHQLADEQSPILKSIPSGSIVTVMSRQGDFISVRTEDGTQGWVAANFLVKSKPATKEYDNLFKQYQKTVETLKVVNEQLTKKDRELQIKRDQLSNATTTIKELKKGIVRSQPVTENNGNVVNADELEKATQEIKRLKTKLLGLQQQAKDNKDLDPNNTQSKLIKAQQDNTLMRNSIEMALASLEGKHVPTAEELAGIRASFPAWYWGLTFVMIILGVIGGVVWNDYKNRKRHGGFRI
ncbi:hypothetical protein MNBD_GAMMA23-2239 [hydrothermal vent metagenome]|uniref:SH3b domain-containing protein n=1 Tax=hydrothermal vent metagenome TaxID=652676 RepID=A0A3B1A2F1_9ZZZZ